MTEQLVAKNICKYFFIKQLTKENWVRLLKETMSIKCKHLPSKITAAYCEPEKWKPHVSVGYSHGASLSPDTRVSMNNREAAMLIPILSPYQPPKQIKCLIQGRLLSAPQPLPGPQGTMPTGINFADQTLRQQCSYFIQTAGLSGLCGNDINLTSAENNENGCSFWQWLCQ